MSTTLWLLGYPDQALKMSAEATALAQTLAHPSSLAFARVHAGGVHKLRGEEQAAQESAAALIALSTEQKFALMLALGTLLQGQVLAEQGKGEEGLALILQGLTAHKATGADHRRPRFFSALAWVYRKIGQPEEGLAQLATAFAVMSNTGERQWEAELYRLKGELTLQLETRGWRLETGRKISQKSKGKNQKSKIPNPQPLTPSTQVEAEAEACFHKAIEIACNQQAKSWELRATMGLARLWQSQGKHHAARNTLSEIYNWFTEGFDTKDLQEAKALLEELSR
jgi:predicted ATPase